MHRFFNGLLSIVLTASLIFFSFQTLDAETLALNEYNCQSTDSYQNIINIILIDRTTALNDKSNLSLQNGIKSIIMSSDIHGRLQILEVGQNDFTADSVADYCLDEYTTNKQKKVESNAFNKTLAAILEKFGLYHKIEFDDSIDIERIDRINKYRDNIFRQLKVYLSHQKSNTSATSIISLISQCYHHYSLGKKTFNLFIFSDMLDSQISTLLKSNDIKTNGDSYKELAVSQAKLMKDSFGIVSDIKNVNIVVWGLGRSDINSNAKLTLEQYHSLNIFWKTFFTNFFNDPTIILGEYMPEIHSIFKSTPHGFGTSQNY